MPLLKSGKVIKDVFTRLDEGQAIVDEGSILVDLERFLADREALLGRKGEVGVLLRPGEQPDQIENDLDRLALIALEFPAFTDGRAYSSARLLRERYGYRGEVRAVGDVLLEHLHFMARSGFDAFEMDSSDPEADWKIANADMKVWYQPTGDQRKTAMQLRMSKR